MDLTPKQLIEDVEFRDVRRGYDPAEVDAFLDRVASAMAKLHQQASDATARAAAAEAKLAERPPAPVEPDAAAATEQLQRTLVLAQRTADAAVKEAREEAAALLATARDEADRSNQAARDARIAELRELDEVRQSLQADIELLQAHVDAQRLVLSHAVAELQRGLDHPDGLRVSDPVGLSHVAVPSATAPVAEPIAVVPEPVVEPEPQPLVDIRSALDATPDSASRTEPEADYSDQAGYLDQSEVEAESEWAPPPEPALSAEPTPQAVATDPLPIDEPVAESIAAEPIAAEPAAAESIAAEPVAAVPAMPSAAPAPAEPELVVAAPATAPASLLAEPAASMPVEPVLAADPVAEPVAPLEPAPAAEAQPQPDGPVVHAEQAGGDDSQPLTAAPAEELIDLDAPIPPAAPAQLPLDDPGPPTEAIDAIDLPRPDDDDSDDAFLAELRKAMTDEEPLGPRDDDGSMESFALDDPTPRPRARFGRRR